MKTKKNNFFAGYIKYYSIFRIILPLIAILISYFLTKDCSDSEWFCNCNDTDLICRAFSSTLALTVYMNKFIAPITIYMILQIIACIQSFRDINDNNLNALNGLSISFLIITTIFYYYVSSRVGNYTVYATLLISIVLEAFNIICINELYSQKKK